MKEKNKIKAWCVKSRLGNLLIYSINTDLRESIKRVLLAHAINYTEYKKDGFEVVEVRIKEIKE